MKTAISILLSFIVTNILYSVLLLNRLGTPHWKLGVPILTGIIIGIWYYIGSDEL